MNKETRNKLIIGIAALVLIAAFLTVRNFSDNKSYTELQIEFEKYKEQEEAKLELILKEGERLKKDRESKMKELDELQSQLTSLKRLNRIKQIERQELAAKLKNIQETKKNINEKERTAKDNDDILISIFKQ